MDPFYQASPWQTDFHHHIPPHPHPQPQPALAASHAVNVELPPPQQAPVAQLGPGTGPGPGPRNYKSRKYRPCDFCRARQVACKIEVAPPCQLCQSHGRECTFVERPKKKKRPNNNAAAASQNASPVTDVIRDSGIPGQIDPHLTTLGHENNSHLDVAYAAHFDEQLYASQLGLGPYLHYHHQVPNHAAVAHFHQPPTADLSGGHQDRPLDSHSRSARLIGETGESNPYLLHCYNYDDNDECTISEVTYRRIKRTAVSNIPGAKDEPPAVFMLVDDSFAQKAEPRVEEHVLAQARQEISQMFTDEQSFSLLGVYFRFVDPYFPILARSEFFLNGVLRREAINGLPLSLISALYATALPFSLYDELLATTLVHSPDRSNQLYRISSLALAQELHAPRLATLQAALLLLQRKSSHHYTTDTPWKTSLVACAVSLAHNLGLNRDCSDWVSLPMWELTLRKRLWHAVFIMEKWTSLGAGTPSHIHTEGFDVKPLWPSDCEATDILGAECHFRLLTKLTAILSDGMKTYYSVRAVQRTSKDFLLSLDLARPLRGRLKCWSDSSASVLSSHLPDSVGYHGMAVLGGHSSLRLAFIVVNMTIFRALLRPVENMSSIERQDHGTLGRRMAVRAGAKECAEEAVEFAENLETGATNAFWHSWSRANFGIASSFLVQLLLTAESEAEVAEVNGLIARWRWAMRVASGGSGSGITSLGLLGYDGLVGGDGEDGSGGGGMGSDVDGRSMKISLT